MEKNRIENINLHDLVENQDNPRTIEPQQMQKLVESILTFPKMLQMRPIVCNENRVILGGNMRFRALLNIEQMEDEAIKGAFDVDDMQRWGLNPWEIQQEATTYEPEEDEEQRIIIVYRSEDSQAVADMLGLDAIEKRNFDVEELKEKPE